MDDGVRISEASRRLGVSCQYLRLLEWQGIVPPVRRDCSGRLYSEQDIGMMRAMGVGRHPQRLKRPEDVLEQAR